MHQFRPDRAFPPSHRPLSTVLQRLARSLVPSLADFCFVHVADRQHLRCAACAHATRKGQRVVGELGRVYRIVRDDPASTVAQVVRSGRLQLRSEIAPDRDLRLSPRAADVHRQLAPRSAIVVPLLAGRDVVGALTLGYADSARRYTPEDVPIAKLLARRIARYVRRPHPSGNGVRAGARPAATPVRRLPPLRARI